MHEFLNNEMIHLAFDTGQPKKFYIILWIFVMRNKSLLLIRRLRKFPIFASDVGSRKDWEKQF